MASTDSAKSATIRSARCGCRRFLTPRCASSALKSSKVAEPRMNATVPRTRYVVFFAIAIGGCALDLWTKHWIFGRLGMPGGDAIWLWKPYFSLATSLNEGALFGWGQGKGMLFSCLSVVAALGVIYWLFIGQAARDRWLTIALACVMAGIFGNLY